MSDPTKISDERLDDLDREVRLLVQKIIRVSIDPLEIAIALSSTIASVDAALIADGSFAKYVGDMAITAAKKMALPKVPYTIDEDKKKA